MRILNRTHKVFESCVLTYICSTVVWIPLICQHSSMVEWISCLIVFLFRNHFFLFSLTHNLHGSVRTPITLIARQSKFEFDGNHDCYSSKQSSDLTEVLHVPRQLCCLGMCKSSLWSDWYSRRYKQTYINEILNSIDVSVVGLTVSPAPPQPDWGVTCIIHSLGTG